MSRHLLAALLIGGASLLAFGCDKSDTEEGTGGAGGAGGAACDDLGCNGTCEKGNDIGIGHYCTPGGGECDETTQAFFCTADFNDTDLWFCTKPCNDTAACGEGAVCEIEEDGGPSGCFPEFCYDEGSGGSSAGGSSAGGSSAGGGGAGGAGGN